MSDIIIFPRIIWKVDLSELTPLSKSHCQFIHILKSYWRLEIKLELEEYRVYIMPENPVFYLNMRFLVKCGVKDIYGASSFKSMKSLTTENLLKFCIWRAEKRLILDESEALVQNYVLWIECTVKPELTLPAYMSLQESSTTASFRTVASSKNDLMVNLKYLLKHSLHYDVTLECDNKYITAHRSILSCRSGFFEAMFRSATKEAREGKAPLNGTSFYILEKIIQYIYTSEIKLESVFLASEIYIDADKFLIEPLKEECRAFFKDNLCESCPRCDLESIVVDACRVLCLANYYGDKPLQNWIKDYLADAALLTTPQWKSFSEDEPEAAIEVYFILLGKVNKDNS